MKKAVSFSALLVVALLCSISIPRASAQAVYGSILGTVTDPQGAAVVGAKVTVTDQNKGTSLETTSNESGNYSVTHLIPGTYSVKVEGQGFKTSSQKDVLVSADTGARVDLRLQLGSASEAVEVTAEAPQLKTDRADVAIEFNQRYVEDLPVLNRNFTSFELLSPGTQKLVGWSHAATENPQGGQQIFVNGQHFSGTGFELDGTDNQDPILGIIVVNPNLEAIQETKIALQNYDAEFGKAVAGLVTVQTKSGSNDLHGSAFYVRRTDALAARDPFTQYAPDPLTHRFIPSARWQQFGGTLGGPIIKNKLFFFGDYQGTRQKVGITNALSIPTATVLSTCTQATGFCDLSEYLNNVTGGGQVYDPATGNPDGTLRTPFSGNLIPVDRLSPQAVAILKAFPQPQNGGLVHNYIASGSGPYTQNSFDTREDFNASPTLQIFGRFSLDYFSLSGNGSLQSVNGQPALGGIGFGPGGLAGTSTIHNISLATGFTKTFSSSLLTDFRFGYFKYNPVTSKPDSGTPMDTFGVPGLNNSAQAAFTAGLAGFFLGGQDLGNNAAPANGNQGQAITNFGDGLNVARCNCPLIENEHQYQFVSNWTKIIGNHQIKFGGDIRFAHNLRVPSDANRTGQLNFSPEGTSLQGNGGLDLGTFLLGEVTSFQRYVSTSLDAAESQRRFFTYGQDTWRITSKFTLNYGLRWEIYTPESVNGKDKGGFANIVGNGTNGGGVIRVAGENGFGLNGNIKNNLTSFAPRLGVAYQLTPKTVVRMGYGRSFDIGVFGSNFGHTVTQNLPVLVNQSLSASNLFSTATDNITPVFTLGCNPASPVPCSPFSGGPTLTTPTPYQFPTTFTNGELPLLGPANNVSPKIRPTKQVLPTLDAWNATLQRQVTNTISLEIAYIGNKGTHVFAGDGPSYNINQPSVVGFASGVPQPQRRPFNNKFATPCGDVTCTAPVVTCCSSDLGNYLGNDANSIYNALQVKVEKRFSQGLQLLSHYTFSHANKYDGNYYAINHAIAYGPDDQSRNHVWVNNVVYELPIGKGKKIAGGASRGLDAAIGGWQISTTTNWSSGLPWTPSTAECGAEEDVGVCRPSKGSGSFHVGAGKFDPVTHTVPFFTPLTSLSGPFTDPGVGNLGNIGVNSFRGPRLFAADATVAKNFTITERVKAQFRTNIYNLFNHPVLGFNSNQSGSGQCIDCAGNGLIKDIEADSSPGSTTGMRQIEFALRLSF
jgi:hypothetical protein